jgi:YegS/Rv2252/BmrU family lipid kinase
MNKKIAFLINPISGTKGKEKIKALIESETKKEQIPFEILATNAEANYDFVKDKITNEGFTHIIVVGGDGTVNQVINALRFEPVIFGIIPMGSGNGLARAAGISMKPKKALVQIFHGLSKKTDAFLINGQFSCVLSGLGFDAKVAYEFSTKNARGLFTYTTQGLIEFFKTQPYQFEVSINGFSFFTDAFFISIANCNQFGNNVTIAPKASLQDGLLDIVVVQKMSKSILPFAVLKQIRGNNILQEQVNQITKNNILYFQTPQLKIKNLKYAPLHIDGEPKETSSEFTIEVIKGCFDLIQS